MTTLNSKRIGAYEKIRSVDPRYGQEIRADLYNLLFDDIHAMNEEINGMLGITNIDCSANPNYPASLENQGYRVSVAGKIGGAAGLDVEQGDLIICIVASATGDHATVGANFMIVQKNMIACLVAVLRTGTNNTDFVTAKTLADQAFTFAAAAFGFTGTFTNTGTIKGTALETILAATYLSLSGYTIQASGTDATVDVVIASKSTGSVVFKTNGADQWSINGSGVFVPVSDNTKDIGNLSLNPRNVYASGTFVKKANAAGEGYGQLALKSITMLHAITNAQTNVIAIQIPAGAKLVSSQLRNNNLIAGVDDATGLVPIVSFNAAYSTGASQAVGTGILLAKNTKTDKFFDVNAATDITSGLTDITIDAGVGNKFTAGGSIVAVAYYYEMTSLTDAS